MRRSTRRVLFWFFVLGFFVAAPAVILYAAGYRYSFSEHRLTKTGTLIVSTIPRQADLFLNHERVGPTPATIRALLPGRYDVTLDKVGYLRWEKRISILENEAFFLSKVRLFPATLPVLLQAGRAGKLLTTANRKYVLWHELPTEPKTNESRHRLWLWNTTATQTPTRIFESPANSISILGLSPDGNQVLLNIDDVLSFLAITTPDQTMAIPIATVPTDTVQWRWNNQNALYLATPQAIHAVQTTPTTAAVMRVPVWKVATGEALLDFSISSETAMTVLLKEADGDHVVRTVSTQNTDATPTTQLSLGGRKPTTILAATSDLLLLSDASQSITYWHNGRTAALRLLLEAPGVLHTDIAPQSGELLYATAFEIWSFSPANAKKTLLVRTASPIISAHWNATTDYIFYAANGFLAVLERYGQEPRNHWILGRFTAVTDLILDEASQSFLVSGTVGNVVGLYQRVLQ